MTAREWSLFAAMGAIWGVPYLLIKVAVEDLSPPVVVFGRTSIAAAALVLLAWHQDALRPALRRWRPVLAFAAIEMAGPWLLLTHAEQRLPSGLTGLLVACVPIVGAVTAYVLGDRTALRPERLVGIALGLGGVALLVGHDLGGEGGVPWWRVGEVLLVCVAYAVAPFIAARRLHDVPSIGVVAVSLAAVAIGYAPFAWLRRPDDVPPADAVWAVVGLAVLCTGVAFVVFFRLIAEVGPDRATLITFVNPAVAIVLGALVLDEEITAATIGGFALVLSGCWLATRPARARAGAGARSGRSRPGSPGGHDAHGERRAPGERPEPGERRERRAPVERPEPVEPGERRERRAPGERPEPVEHGERRERDQSTPQAIGGT
jgi:drug/metabolite transporter (DMT)-like permease